MPWSKVALFSLLFFTYVGIEAGLGSWAPTHLKQIGNPNPEVATSGYWLAITVGRLGFAAFGSRLNAPRVALTCVGLSLLGLAMMAVPALVVAGYVVVGLGAAPIFSTLLAWFASRFPARVSPLMLTAGSLGGAVLPALIGLLVARWGVQAIPWAVGADAAVLGLLVLLVRRNLGGS